MSDEGFLDRVVKMSAAVSVFTALFLLALGLNRAAGSFLIGAALSMLFLFGGRWSVQKAFSPGRKSYKAVAVAFMAGKYAIAALVIWLFVKWRGHDYGGFVGGAAVTQLVLLLKALGTVYSDSLKPAGKGHLTRIRK